MWPKTQSFNTQPPEGGWMIALKFLLFLVRFQHTAARRRLVNDKIIPNLPIPVSTHSRPKAAGVGFMTNDGKCRLFQHTAARRRLDLIQMMIHLIKMFQHTAARRRLVQTYPQNQYQHGFNTQPPEGGWLSAFNQPFLTGWFQHTAARRRLAMLSRAIELCPLQFQHTAARRRLAHICTRCDVRKQRFNTQPPEGGWAEGKHTISFKPCFNTQPPEGGWISCPPATWRTSSFQHTAARRRLVKNENVRKSSRLVSTHSRPKAAGSPNLRRPSMFYPFQHTAARRRLA